MGFVASGGICRNRLWRDLSPLPFAGSVIAAHDTRCLPKDPLRLQTAGFGARCGISHGL